MAKIRAEDVAEVRQTARIEEVVGQSVALKPAGGGSLKGLCPFHDERSPSFQVSPGKGLWYCFGCGEGGDTIDFVMRTDALSFAEAVEKLAQNFGVALRYEEGSVAPGRQQGQRTRLILANKEAQAFFTEQLGTSAAEVARQFLSERGFDEATWSHFGVGFAPKSWNALTDRLRARGFRDDELRAAGLVSDGQRGAYDRFRGRLIWPIRDLGGEVVGFGARRLFDDDQGPKYLNTPETPLYKKSHVLYGLDLARPAIVKGQQAVIVEGYTDVMACHVAGVTTAVATCGTSFGDGHVKILRRLLLDNDAMRGRVVFTFDGDAAGQRAALRAFETDQSFVAQTYVAVEPSGMDPCDLRLAQGDHAVRELVERARPMFEFAITSTIAAYDLSTAEGRIAAMRACAPMLQSIRDVALRGEYVNRLAGWVGVDETTVRHAVQQSAKQGNWDKRSAERPLPNGSPGGLTNPALGTADEADLRLERQAIQVMVQRPDLVWEWILSTEEAAFTDPSAAAIFRVIASVEEPVGGDDASLRGWLDSVLAVAPDDAVRAELRRWSVLGLPVTDPAAIAGYAQAVMAKLHAWDVTRRIGPLKGRLARIDPAVQSAEFAETMTALMDLENYRRELLSMAVGEGE